MDEKPTVNMRFLFRLLAETHWNKLPSPGVISKICERPTMFKYSEKPLA